MVHDELASTNPAPTPGPCRFGIRLPFATRLAKGSCAAIPREYRLKSTWSIGENEVGQLRAWNGVRRHCRPLL